MGNPVFSAVLYRSWVKRLLSIILFVVTITILGNSVSFASSDADHKSKGWVATDSYRVLNFGVLAIGLFFLLRKPVRNALSGRVEGIKIKLQELEIQKSNIESELVEYNDKLAKLDAEAEVIMSEYVKQGEAAKAKILSEAEIAASKLKEQAKKSIEYEFNEAKIRLKRDIVDKALSKAERIIRQKIDSNDQEKLVDEYLDKVVA